MPRARAVNSHWYLLVLFRAQFGVGVRNFYRQLLCTLDNVFTFLAGYCARDFGRVSAVLHQQQLQILQESKP